MCQVSFTPSRGCKQLLPLWSFSFVFLDSQGIATCYILSQIWVRKYLYRYPFKHQIYRYRYICSVDKYTKSSISFKAWTFKTWPSAWSLCGDSFLPLTLIPSIQNSSVFVTEVTVQMLLYEALNMRIYSFFLLLAKRLQGIIFHMLETSIFSKDLWPSLKTFLFTTEEGSIFNSEFVKNTLKKGNKIKYSHN